MNMSSSFSPSQSKSSFFCFCFFFGEGVTVSGVSQIEDSSELRLNESAVFGDANATAVDFEAACKALCLALTRSLFGSYLMSLSFVRLTLISLFSRAFVLAACWLTRSCFIDMSSSWLFSLTWSFSMSARYTSN